MRSNNGIGVLWIFSLLCVSVLFAAACTSTGPQKSLNALADALDKRDDKAFLALLDVKPFAANQAKNLTSDNEALSSLDSLGRALGLGGVDALLGSVLDMEQRLKAQYTRGVATGELEMQCRAAESPDCPWVAEALRKAEVKLLGDTAAVAEVTTPARITSRLALRKQGETWLVVGQAPLAATAEKYARESASQKTAPAKAKQAPAAPEKAKPAPEKAKPAPKPEQNNGIGKV